MREVRLGLAGKAHNDVGREIHARSRAAQGFDDLQVARPRVGPVHRAQDAVAARLERQVDAFTQLGQPAVGLNQVLGEAPGMGRGESEARQAVDFMEALKQLHKRSRAAGGRILLSSRTPAVAGDDLAKQGDLPHAALRQRAAFRHDVVHRARTLVAARLRHDAEGAIHVAALLDGDEGGDLPLVQHVVANGVLRAGLLGNVDDRVAHGHAGRAGGAEVVQIAGHLVKLLGADDEVDVGQQVEQRGAAVLRHAPQDAEDELRPAFFARGHVARLADRLLLGEVADAAGVEQHDVAVVLVLDKAISAGTQQRGDGLAVARVHLAPVGFDIDAVQRSEGF